MKTGFKDLDNIIELNRGELIVVASRPAMGKTTFVQNILNNVAIKNKRAVLFYNLETSDTPYTIDDVCIKSRESKLKKDIKLIIIDYLQLIQFDKKELLSRDNEITEILKRLKILARELDVPIIITSQLSREVEKREDKKPCITDFSNSKNAILTYSDKILFLYRDSYYNEKSKSNVTDVIVAKNNDGGINTIKLAWIPEYCMFGNITTFEDQEELIPKKAYYPTMLHELEKEEINDDYNLINSKSIGDYCRSIKHKFNTEELAVLVFRNCKMSIDEKIEKYNDLIKNYPDMEVIERINCKHYDSVKTMIKKEIKRLNILYKKLLEENDNSIYTWTEYNKSTLKIEHNRDLEHTFKTYKEAIKDVQNYIKEYNDTISFRITKKYFDKRKGDIFADYNVEKKKSKLINLMKSNDNFLDIDQIFLNIPTPFKKGDILVSNSIEIGTRGDSNEIFVLEYLCTWRDNLSKLLANGNYDSSDMIGYGYYFYDENSTDFIRDDKFNYDSFEYYDGELKGKNRILKDISNFMKGKIELELFVHAYDYFKSDFKNEFPDFYTDEGLKLAGFSDIDILQKNHESEKIYNMPNEKRDDYLKHRTCIYEKLEEKEILQIETDFNNKVFLLTKNGILYKTELYEHELLKISENIRKIHFLDGNHLYKISNENIIQPIEDKNSCDNTDSYLNNNNCKYKKIETSKMHIVLLTQDGNVRAVCGGYPNLGIIPENFTNVNDITIVTNENGIDMPYIYKNDMFIELYIE